MTEIGIHYYHSKQYQRKERSRDSQIAWNKERIINTNAKNKVSISFQSDGKVSGVFFRPDEWNDSLSIIVNKTDAISRVSYM